VWVLMRPPSYKQVVVQYPPSQQVVQNMTPPSGRKTVEVVQAAYVLRGEASTRANRNKVAIRVFMGCP